jgi:hypothetical protein
MRDCHFERCSPWKSLGPHSPGGGAVPRNKRGKQSLSASLHSATFLFWQSPRHRRYQRAQPLSTNQMPQTAIEHKNMENLSYGSPFGSPAPLPVMWRVSVQDKTRSSSVLA